MSYELEFDTKALKEWNKLDNSIRSQFKKKLAERLIEPHVPASRLSGSDNFYKIKLRQSGFRLAYYVDDERVVVLVLSVGKRERNTIYYKALERLEK